MMGGRTVEGGNRARPTAEGSARAPRARGNTQGPGAMDLRFLECTPGPVGTVTRERGHKARGMASAWRPKAGGSTRGSGRKGSKDAMGDSRAPAAGRVMKAPGATAYKMDMGPRPILMEVRTLAYVKHFHSVKQTKFIWPFLPERKQQSELLTHFPHLVCLIVL